MLLNRCIKLSLRDEVRRILALETGDLPRFIVYGDDEMRGMEDGTFTPTSTEPYCFVVISKVEPTSKAQLPFIAVDTLPIRRIPLELGNRQGRRADATLNILGRTEGEVSDIASYLADSIANFPIKNYNEVAYRSTMPFATMAWAELTNEPSIEGPGPLADLLLLEGRVYNWEVVTFSFQTLI